MTDQHPITPPPERQPTFAELLMPIPKAPVESQTSGNCPITPPPELVEQWHESWFNLPRGQQAPYKLWMAAQAARWGADQGLEACCEWLDMGCYQCSVALRAALRPKSPSLKELNLKHLEVMERDGHYLPEIISDLRRAIESMPDV